LNRLDLFSIGHKTQFVFRKYYPPTDIVSVSGDRSSFSPHI